MWTQLNILVTATATPLASQLMAAKAGEAGTGVLSVPLVPVGSSPDTLPTWFGASGAVASELEPMLRDAQILSDETEGTVDLATAQWLLNESDVTDRNVETWESVLERLGLEVQRGEV